MKNHSPRRSYFSLFIGIAFFGYGSYRLISFYLGAATIPFALLWISSLSFLEHGIFIGFSKPLKKNKGLTGGLLY